MLNIKGIYKYIFGNCRNMKEVSTNSIDMILSSFPAYYEEKNREIFKDLFKEFKRVLKRDGPLVFLVSNIKKEGVFIDKRKIIGSLLDESGFKMRNLRVHRAHKHPDFIFVNVDSIIVYSENRIGTKNKMKKDFYNYFWDVPVKKHNVIPSKIWRAWIKHYTNEEDMILDPFAGSGRIMLEARRLRRDCISYEINYGWYKRLTFKHIKDIEIIRRRDSINEFDEKEENMIVTKFYD